MSREVRDWLAALLAEDHEVGRVVGEAVTVLFQGGFGPGAPFVMPLESALRAQHPGIALDHAYQRQLHLLQKVRRSVADLAAARKRLELRIDAGGLDQETLTETRRRYEEAAAEEAQAVVWARRLQAKVDAFRARKEVVKADYTATLAKRAIDEAFAALGEPPVLGPATHEMGSAEAAAELLRTVADLERRLGADASPDINELRLAAPPVRGHVTGHGGTAGRGNRPRRLGPVVRGGSTPGPGRTRAQG